MSDIIHLSDVSLLPVDNMKAKELREYSLNQFRTIISLTQENQILKDKVNHLEQLLVTPALPLSNEEIICIEQITILRQRSTNRELSLDEVKRLDLLIKNLRLIREQSTQVIDSKDYSNMKEADLVAAITSPDTTEHI